MRAQISASELEEQKDQPEGGFARLRKFLSDPTTDALLGGPWGALGAIKHFYHGTQPSRAKEIESTGFDPTKIGSRNDEGFWGRGFYFTEHPTKQPKVNRPMVTSEDNIPATDYTNPLGVRQSRPAIVKANIDDEHLLDFRQFTEADLANFLRNNETVPLSDPQSMAHQAAEIAQQQGYKGVRWPTQTVVFDKDVIENPRPFFFNRSARRALGMDR